MRRKNNGCWRDYSRSRMKQATLAAAILSLLGSFWPCSLNAQINAPTASADGSEWVGFENSTNVKDRENDLQSHVGQFRRVTAEGNFLDLCNSIGKQCVQVRDWEGRDFTCQGGSNAGRDGTRLALCALPQPHVGVAAPQVPPVSTGTRQTRNAAGGANAIVVPANAGPWNPVLNNAFDYGSHDQAPPAVIAAADSIPFSPGSVLTVAYISGSVSAGGGWPGSDANGALSRAPASTATATGNYPSRYIDPSAYPIYVASLVGTFAKDGVIVGRPFMIGDGPVNLTVPTGANQLLLGVNDDRFGDNSGSWTVAVSGHTSSTALFSVWVLVALILVVGSGGFFLLRRRKASIQRPVAAAGALPWAVPGLGPTRPSAPITMDALETLAELKSQLDRGLITREQFDREKARVLES